MGACRNCGAETMWRKSNTTNRWTQVERAADGNLAIDANGRLRLDLAPGFAGKGEYRVHRCSAKVVTR